MPRKITHGNVQHRDLQVVGYMDLRPIDWASGKRIPLEAGAGHICDRCGAEHAIVWTLVDATTGEAFRVGSTCAKRTWGFNPDENPRGRKLIDEFKLRSEIEVYQKRLSRSSAITRSVVEQIMSLPIPDPEMRDTIPMSGGRSGETTVRWRMGDSLANQQPWSNKAEVMKLLVVNWYRNRAKDLIPKEWFRLVIKDPRDRFDHGTDMGSNAENEILKTLRARLPEHLNPWKQP